MSSRLGHRDSGVTHRIYIHAYESAQRSEARAGRLEAMYGVGAGNNVETPNGTNSQETAVDQEKIASLDARRSASQ